MNPLRTYISTEFECIRHKLSEDACLVETVVDLTSDTSSQSLTLIDKILLDFQIAEARILSDVKCLYSREIGQ